MTANVYRVAGVVVLRAADNLSARPVVHRGAVGPRQGQRQREQPEKPRVLHRRVPGQISAFFSRWGRAFSGLSAVARADGLNQFTIPRPKEEIHCHSAGVK